MALDRTQANKFYNEIVAVLNSNVGLQTKLGWMAAHGSSVVVNYGDDTEQWEVSWITSGNRFTAVRADVLDAVKDVLGQVRTDLLMRMTSGEVDG